MPYQLRREGRWRFVGATGWSPLWWVHAAGGCIALSAGIATLNLAPIGAGLLLLAALVHDGLWCYASGGDDGIEWRTLVIRRRVPWSDIERVSVAPFSPVVNMINTECVVLYRVGRLRGQRVRPSAAASRAARLAFEKAVERVAAAHGIATTVPQQPSAPRRTARVIMAAGAAALIGRRNGAGRR